jgi:DNA-directed RNA polymerase specialized sigma24 family protein
VTLEHIDLELRRWLPRTVRDIGLGDAEDAIQEALIATWRAMEADACEDPVRYAFGVLRNRKAAAIAERQMDRRRHAGLMSLAHRLPARGIDPLRKRQAEEHLARVRRRLSPRCRRVMELVAGGKSFAEVRAEMRLDAAQWRGLRHRVMRAAQAA